MTYNDNNLLTSVRLLVLGLWAPFLTLVCVRFPGLAIYHDGGTISGSDAGIDEGIGEWMS